MKRPGDLKTNMKCLITILFFVISGNTLANCVNYTNEYTITKELISVDTTLTQVSGEISIHTTDNNSIVQDRQVIKNNAVNKTDYCIFNKRSMTLTLIYQTDKYSLTPQHYQAINEYLDLVDIDKRILVEGHADDVGSVSYNEKLSKRRSDEVGKYLKSTLSLGNRIIEKSFGESIPFCNSEENSISGCNRRVLIRVL